MPKDSDALVQAVASGDVEQIKKLIAGGASVNEPDALGRLPLAAAAQRGKTELVRLLLGAGANVNGVTPQRKKPPLTLAAREGHADTFTVLLAAGANVNQQGEGATPLTAAVSERSQKHEQMVQALLAAGADVNHGQFDTVLMRACGNSSVQVIKALIEKGANVNAATKSGSALRIAIRENRPEIVAILLEAGADPHARFAADANPDIAGKTPLEYARETKNKKIIALLEEPARPPAAKPKGKPEKPGFLWERIEAWLAQHKPELQATLNPGVSPRELEQVEKAIGKKLPDDFKEAYLVHNGQKGGGDLVPPLVNDEEGYFLMPADEMINEWKSWKSIVDAGEFIGQESNPDKGIESVWWHPGWVPFASNGAGDSICLDLAPAAGGGVGQVITMNHESKKRELLAASFAEWLTELAEAIEDGALE